MYEDENNLYHYSYRKGNEYDPNVPIDTKNYADEPSDQNRGSGSGKKKGVAKIVALALVCALVGGLVGAGASSAAAKVNHTSIQISDREVAQVQTVKVDGKTQMTMPEVYASNVNSVVSINVSATTNYFGQTVQTAASGTGFFITEDGYILTNYHVISYAAQGNYAITVMTYDGASYTAKIVGVDSSNDIAVLKIDATELTPVTFGDSDEMSVGDTVYAVGNPLGELQFTMTTGHVSALDRTITTDEGSVPINMFQIDAAVNSGNSGGPVYNDAGQVIGIVTAKYSSTGVEGLGFAIPINDAVNLANELMENGVVTNKVQLGITTQTVPASVAQYYNMVEGAYVYSVNAGSCAEKAGLQIGDIITAVGGKAVASSDALKAALRSFAPGDTTELTVYRGGKTVTVTVTLDEADESTAAQQQTQQQTQQRTLP